MYTMMKKNLSVAVVDSDIFITEHVDENVGGTAGGIVLAPHEKIHLYIKAELSDELIGNSVLSTDHITIMLPFYQRVGY